MANRCASLHPTWAHHPAPAPSPWLSTAAAFENDQLTSALRASMSGASSPTPSSSTTSSASEILATPYDAPACKAGPSPARAQTRPGVTGRVSKRKPRASRRAQTTYISADPANFRRMVHEITGFSVHGAEPAFAEASPGPSPAALACVLPTLDTSAFLLDSAPAPPGREEDKTSSRAGATMPAAVAAMEAEESSLLLELEAMVSAPVVVSAFPTLESWGMI